MASLAIREAAGRRLDAPRVFRDRSPGFVDSDTIGDVFRELDRQCKKFGAQHLTMLDWASTLGEKYGEVCRAVNELHFNDQQGLESLRNLYDECVQVATVALHMAQVVAATGEIERGEA